MAVDILLTLDDIKGESKIKDHLEEIDVLSWSWSMTQSGTMHQGGGGGAGKVSVQDITLTKYVDKASTNLMRYCCSGKHIDEGTLLVRKAGGDPLDYLLITMTKVIVTSVSTGGAGGEERLTENVSLNFEKVKVDYLPQSGKGTEEGGVEFEWDIAANEDPGV